jgi:hypothetical protein
MEELKKRFSEIITAYYSEEKGNRVSMFSLTALSQTLLAEVEKAAVTAAKEAKDGDNN